MELVLDKANLVAVLVGKCNVEHANLSIFCYNEQENQHYGKKVPPKEQNVLKCAEWKNKSNPHKGLVILHAAVVYAELNHWGVMVLEHDVLQNQLAKCFKDYKMLLGLCKGAMVNKPDRYIKTFEKSIAGRRFYPVEISLLFDESELEQVRKVCSSTYHPTTRRATY